MKVQSDIMCLLQLRLSILDLPAFVQVRNSLIFLEFSAVLARVCLCSEGAITKEF